MTAATGLAAVVVCSVGVSVAAGAAVGAATGAAGLSGAFVSTGVFIATGSAGLGFIMKNAPAASAAAANNPPITRSLPLPDSFSAGLATATAAAP